MPPLLRTSTLGTRRQKGVTTSRALVVHASKYGSTEEVARAVGDVLADRGLRCDVIPAGDASEIDGYDLVVLGGGLYMSRLHKDAQKFLRRHRNALEHVPFAVFAMGPLSAEPEEIDKVRPQLEHALERVPELHPFATAVFGGVIVPERLHFPFNKMPAGDHRDWDEIRRFAESLTTHVRVAA
jgi:menaquinone-dependent protoporphyrinogen oxidase